MLSVVHSAHKPCRAALNSMLSCCNTVYINMLLRLRALCMAHLFLCQRPGCSCLEFAPPRSCDTSNILLLTCFNRPCSPAKTQTRRPDNRRPLQRASQPVQHTRQQHWMRAFQEAPSCLPPTGSTRHAPPGSCTQTIHQCGQSHMGGLVLCQAQHRIDQAHILPAQTDGSRQHGSAHDEGTRTRFGGTIVMCAPVGLRPALYYCMQKGWRQVAVSCCAAVTESVAVDLHAATPASH